MRGGRSRFQVLILSSRAREMVDLALEVRVCRHELAILYDWPSGRGLTVGLAIDTPLIESLK